jgi:hypothetical protein
MAEVKGRCRCGGVSYASTAEPVFVGICHCTNCQKSTGSAYATVLAVPTDSLTISGTTQRFDDMADSGKGVHRDFCPKCGSTVTQTADVMAGLTMVPVGTLDDAAAFKPAMQIYCDSAMPWAPLAGDIARFPKMP